MKHTVHWGLIALGLVGAQPAWALALHPLDEVDWAVIERAETLSGLHGYPHLDKAVGWSEGRALLALPDLDPFTRVLLERISPEMESGVHGKLGLGGVYSKGQGVSTLDPPSNDHSPLSDKRWGMWDPARASLQGYARLALDGEGWALRLGGVGATGSGRQVGVVTDAEGRLRLGNQVVAAGRGKTFWGYGSHGSLSLGDNAQPLDRIAIGNDQAYDSWVGPLRYELSVSQLEAGRAVPKPLWMGIHFDFQPTDRVELGFWRVIMMGGQGRPSPWSLSRFVRVLSGVNVGGTVNGAANVDTSNSIAGFGASYLVGGVKIYLDLAGEDEAHALPSQPAAIVGFYRPGLAPDGRGDLRMEWARTGVYGDQSWYRHHIYTDGYTYRDGLLGHHVGTNGSDYFLSYRVWDQLGGWIEFNFENEKRAITHDSRVSERRSQIFLSGHTPLGETLALDWMGGVERIDNPGGGWQLGLDGVYYDANLKSGSWSTRAAVSLDWHF